MLTAIGRKILQISGLDADLQPGDVIAANLVNAETIASINEQFLSHAGPTDVITFDYRDEPDVGAERTAAELFICPEVALQRVENRQMETLKTVGEEVVLYFVHGILHLCSLDDQTTADAREMRAAERRVVDQLAAEFDLTAVAVRGGTKTAT